jgi:hypothetical protein
MTAVKGQINLGNRCTYFILNLFNVGNHVFVFLEFILLVVASSLWDGGIIHVRCDSILVSRFITFVNVIGVRNNNRC